MKIVTTVAELRAEIAALRKAGRSVGLVPTMGFLHEGHLTLIRESVARCDATVVSIFVNPTQFAPTEDFTTYPRDTERDERLCREAGTDILFMPGLDEVYPPGHQTMVEPGALAEPLCGRFRPGHFRGVATVVAKLFNMVRADVAFFGRKDYQQSLVVRRMAIDLDMAVEVVTVPTVREPDGLAMSSRNAYLSADERKRALGLSRGLFAARDAFAGGERSADRLLAIARSEMAEIDKLQYLDLADAATLDPVTGTVDRPAVMAVASYVGKTRLIDNVLLDAAD